MKDKKLRDMSKEELIAEAGQGAIPNRSVIALILSGVLVILLSFVDHSVNSEDPGYVVHFTTMIVPAMLLASLFSDVFYKLKSNTRRIEALTELLRKSNVIND